MRTRGVERGGIEVGGKLKLTVNGNRDGSGYDEENHNEAGVALAGLALGPRIVDERFLGAEQVAHHCIRHRC